MPVRLCNPYSGNEKGNVENAVGYLRRNLMVPKPHVESFGQLSRLLLERYEAMASTAVSSADPGSSVADRFAHDRGALVPLPSQPFDAVSCHNRKADKYGRVEFASNHYQAGAASSAGSFWSRLAGTASLCTTRTMTP